MDWTAMSPKEREEFEALFQAGDPISVDPNALERKFTIPERNRAIAEGATADGGLFLDPWHPTPPAHELAARAIAEALACAIPRDGLAANAPACAR